MEFWGKCVSAREILLLLYSTLIPQAPEDIKLGQ